MHTDSGLKSLLKNYVLFQDAIQFDADLLANSERSLETLVSVGMSLGVSKRDKGLQFPGLQKCSLA
jgi:phosphatidylserine decarboxylase